MRPVGPQVHQLDAAYAALADPTRRAVLERLREGDLRVTELAAPFDVSLNAVSKHLKVLERAGLVTRRVQGREHWISLDPRPLAQAAVWVEMYRVFWERRLDDLERVLAEDAAGSRGVP